MALSAVACGVGMGAHDVLLAVIFGGGFLLLSPAVHRRARARAALIVVLAIAALAPHFLEFARHALASARSQLDYQRLFVVPPSELFTTLVVASRASLERGDAIHYGGAVLLLIAVGLWQLRSREHDGVGRLVIALGVVPFVIVLTGLSLPGVVSTVPLIRGMNLNRTLWFADIFLVLSAGVAMAGLLEQRAIRGRAWLAFVVVLIALSPRLPVAWSQLTKFQGTAADFEFEPRQFLGLLEPGTRLATDMDPMFGNFDIRAIPSGVLASTGRSILMNARLRERLAADGLIVAGWHGMTYAFAPVPPDRLAPLGIRYFATKEHSEVLASLGWRQIGRDKGVDLFVAPGKITPIYVDGPAPEFLSAHRIRWNTIDITIPPGGPRTVVAAFADIGGWRATFDGEQVPVETRHGLIAATVIGGGGLRFVYEPYSAMTIIAVCIAAWLALALVIARYR